MARKPSVWFRKQDQHYYTTIRGEKIKLSPDKGEAETAFHTLMAQKAEEPREVGVFPSFRKIADMFLDVTERTKKPNTFRMHKYLLQSFCTFIGRKKVCDLKVHHVSAWLAAKKPKSKAWNASTACSGRSTLLACLNWAVTEGHIASHPLGKPT